MKNLLLIVFIIAVLITAGCTGEKQTPVVTPTRNPVVTSTPEIVYGTITVLVTPTPGTTVTALSDQNSYQTYTNNEFRFAIQIPKCWTATGDYITTAGSGRKYKVIFDDPTLTSSQYITINSGATGLPLEDYANVFLTNQKTDPTVGVVGQYPVQLDGIPAKKIVLTKGSGEYALESTIIMTVKGDNAYFMEFTSRKDHYPRYSQESDDMIKTIQFT